ncbi:MAG: HNH endonuclease [Anaerolineales bacterium]|nr:HNH endonuclease [Anaerolineales bacterium]
MSLHLSNALLQQLVEVDGVCCAYCQTSEQVTGQPLTIDHIQPVVLGGQSTFENLCRACRRCNEFKGAAVVGIDPLTGIEQPLFNPRRQVWQEHFAWHVAGVYLEGITAVGRATIIQLQINNDLITSARRRWVSAGWHPPT